MILMQYPAAWINEDQKIEELRTFLRVPKSMSVVFCVAANNVEQAIANACLCDCDYFEGDTAITLYLAKKAARIDRITWDRYVTGQTTIFPTDSLLHIRYPELVYYIMISPPTARFVMDYKLENLNQIVNGRSLDFLAFYAILMEECNVKELAEDDYIEDIKRLAIDYQKELQKANTAEKNLLVMHFMKWSFETNLLIPIYALGFRYFDEVCEYKYITEEKSEDITYYTPKIDERQHFAELLIMFRQKKFADVSDEMAREFLNRIQRMALEVFFKYDFLNLPMKRNKEQERIEAPDFMESLTEICEMY